MIAPVFLVDEAAMTAGERITLDGPEGRHAATVRRMRTGERVDLSTGAGRVAECRVVATHRDRLDLDVLVVREVAAAQPRLVVVQALPKGDRGERAVELLTEVGVDAVVPWAAQRCVVRWRAERTANAVARWRATAREAGKQSRRAWLPDVRGLATTADVTGLLAAADARLVLEGQGSVPLGAVTLPAAGEIVVVVGPEGGLTDGELAAFDAVGAQRVRLGPTVLRTSTAGVVASAALLSRTHWLNGPSTNRFG